MTDTSPAADVAQPKQAVFGQSLLSSSLIAMLVRLSGVVLTAAINVFITWHFDPSFAGYFFTAWAVITIAGVLLRCGLDLMVVRTVPILQTKGEEDRIRPLMNQALTFSAATGVFFSVLGLIAIYVAAPKLPENTLFLFATIAVTLPPLSCLALQSECLRSIGHAREGIFALSVVPPAVALSILVLGTGSLGDHSLGIALALGMFAGSGVGYMLLRRRLAGIPSGQTKLQLRPALKEARPYWLLMAVNRGLLPWAMFPILTLFATADQAGQFGIASRIALMTGLPLICVEALIAPKLSKLHRLNHIDAMKRLCQDAAAISLLATSPAILLMIFPEWAMIIFDDSYVAAAPALAILMIGQFTNAALGSVGLCLTMSGHGHLAARASLMSLAVLVGLAILLVPDMGAIGAALATTAALVFNRLMGAIYVYRELGFTSHARISLS